MIRTMLKSKIHRAVVTDADLSYEGSLEIDRDLMDAADIRPFERVFIYNISNGERFETYCIEGERGSGTICLNGAAARKGCPGDLIIIVTYVMCQEAEMSSGYTRLVWVDENNRIKDLKKESWV